MATMENKVVMSMEDICDTGLVLGLGSRCDHPSLIKLRPAPKLNIVEPSLTLGLSDDAYKSSMTTATNKETSLSTPQSSTSPHSTTNSSFSSAKPPSTGIKREMVDEEEEEGSTGTRKKLRLTKEQSALLEDKFKEHNTLNPKQKQALAKQLNLRPRQVEVWFQNRRARTKLKQTEVDCEVLKRYCETLSEENKRLYKELEELKSLKVTSPPLYMQLPATTLTVCPSCQRVVPPKPQFMNNAFQRSAAC